MMRIWSFRDKCKHLYEYWIINESRKHPCVYPFNNQFDQVFFKIGCVLIHQINFVKMSQWKLESPHTKNKLWKKASNEWTWNRVSMNICKQKWDCILHICIFVISTFASSDTLTKLFWINWKKFIYFSFSKGNSESRVLFTPNWFIHSNRVGN